MIRLALALLMTLGVVVPVTALPLIVEEVGEGSALEQAGLQAGDRLEGWQRVDADRKVIDSGRFESPFHWLEVRYGQSPKGGVVLLVQREEEKLLLDVSNGLWQGNVRPELPEAAEELYRLGSQQLGEGQRLEGLATWRDGAESSQGPTRAWWFLQLAENQSEAGDREEAERAFTSALEATSNGLEGVAVLESRATARKGWSDLTGAEESQREALTKVLEKGPEGLYAARQRILLADILRRLGRMAEAQQEVESGHEIQRRLAPRSLATATGLNVLGVVAWQQDRMDSAEEAFRQSLELRQALVPDSLDVAASFNNLALIATNRGDLAAAQRYHLQALEMRRRIAPGGLEEAASLNNLGIVLLHRGELANAERHYLQSFEIRRRLSPESLDTAGSLNNLGIIARRRGHFARSADYYRQALQIYEKVAPGSPPVATTLNNLGLLSTSQDHFEAAAEYLQRSLAIWREKVPGGLQEASALNNLGLNALQAKRLEEARRFLDQALALRSKHAPGSLEASEVLKNLGQLHSLLGENEQAAARHHEALAIRRQLAPGSLDVADTLYDLGLMAQEGGEMEQALALYRESVQTLDHQLEKVGSWRARGQFRSLYGLYHRALMEVLLELGFPEEAFDLAERSRARSFLALLAERDLTFGVELPDDLLQKRRTLARSYDRTQQQLARIEPGAGQETVQALHRELAGLRQERDDLVERIRQASPQLGALRYPQPLDLEATRRALDPGTLLLSYVVGSEKTHLFVLGREEALAVHVLPVGAEELRRRIALLRKLIVEMPSEGSQVPSTAEALEPLLRRMYDELLRPAESQVERAQRLLLVPSGPLHSLPFGALGRDEPLIARKSLHRVLSVTVYAQLQQGRDAAAHGALPSPQLVAFGDPLLTGVAEEVQKRSARLGQELAPLPSSRQEVEAIGALFESEERRLYLGADATETRAKSVPYTTRYLHFATHGLLDPSSPLDSGLVFSAPEAPRAGLDNGLLQAWEIFEGLRFDADLIVLSACESGLGDEQDGEGLIGLTRAFQYAGARSVISTLWAVDDHTTARFMERFYRHLRAGESKDEALRSAQLETRAAKGSGSPFHWAGFQLVGDWR